MKYEPSFAGYSFSMINLVNLVDASNFGEFAVIMARAGTKAVELVPSMLLGPDWDDCDEIKSLENLHALAASYQVSSIQSLTYGLNLSLTDDIMANPYWQHRFEMLKCLGGFLSCRLFILGSPGQKKLRTDLGDERTHIRLFTHNCKVMAGILGPEGFLCLEHNTLQQGAQYANTLAGVLDVVVNLNALGCANVGINLDTKCLLLEFGSHMHIGSLLSEPKLATRIKSIQVSLDFLSRDCAHCEDDIRVLVSFARENQIPLSLEEFGLREDQLSDYIDLWHAATLGNATRSLPHRV
jgi:sugar phosphate isomerase/epimerase